MRALLNNIENKRQVYLFGLYYLVLLGVAVSWTEEGMVAPPTVTRIAFIAAFVLPMFKFPFLAPALVTVFASIRLFSVAPFGYLPTQSIFYLALMGVLYIYYLYYGHSSGKVNRYFLALLFLSVISNLLNNLLELEKRLRDAQSTEKSRRARGAGFTLAAYSAPEHWHGKTEDSSPWHTPSSSLVLPAT